MRRLGFRLLPIIAIFGCGPDRRDGGGAPAVTIASVTPNAGVRTGGTVVRVEGRGFGATPFVTLGAANVQELLLVTDEVIELVAPPDNVGPANLTVVNAGGGRATRLDAFFYLPLPPVAFERRFFADSPDEAGANPVLVTGTGQEIAQLDVYVPRADTGAIEGTITDAAGAPLAGHDVVATSLASGLPVATLTGVDGRYRIEGLVPGAWTVRTDEEAGSPYSDQAWPGVSRSLDAEPVAVVAGSATAGIDLALELGGFVRGTVSGGGAPIAGATVYAYPVVPDPLQFAYGATDVAGGFELGPLAPGAYVVVASAFGSGRIGEYWPDARLPEDSTPVVVSAAATATADFDLDAGGALSGEVIEDSPTPAGLPGVTVIAHELAQGLTASTATAADGSWRIGELPPGSWHVEVPELGQWYAGVTSSAGATAIAVFAGAETEGVSFLGRLGAAPCGDPGGTGTVTGAVFAGTSGVPVLRADVLLLPTSGGDVALAVSGRDGAWTADCVVPGIYTVRVVPSNRDLLAVDAVAGLSVDTGSAGPIVTSLPRGATLRGTVRDAEDHAPLRGVPVRVRDPATGASRIVLTGSDGRWTADRTALGGLGPGAWRVEVLAHVQSEHLP